VIATGRLALILARGGLLGWCRWKKIARTSSAIVCGSQRLPNIAIYDLAGFSVAWAGLGRVLVNHICKAKLTK
jgi:hypothetical protein